MKKMLLTAVAAVASIACAFAQTQSSSSSSPSFSRPKLSVGFDFGVPLDNAFKHHYTIGFGGSGKLEVPVASKLKLTFTAGYINYYFDSPYKDISKQAGVDTYSGFIPVKAGGKFFFANNFYGEAEAGVRFGTNNNTGTRFLYAPGLGCSFPVSDKHDIDFGARYEGWSQSKGGDTKQVAFRIAYKFGL